jgi:putative transposase
MSPGRKQIRLDRQVYCSSGTAFSITIRTADKEPIFASECYARPIFDAVFQAPFALRTDCHAACLVPDHIHMLLAPREYDLVCALQHWKAWTTRHLHVLGRLGGIWQRSFYDHALRPGEGLTACTLYIVNNPVRRGLVSHWADYPYAWCRGQP